MATSAYSGFPSGFSNMASINLDPQPSGSNQDSAERNKVVLPGQGPQRASIARDRSQRSTIGKCSEQGNKADVTKDWFTREAAVLSE